MSESKYKVIECEDYSSQKKCYDVVVWYDHRWVVVKRFDFEDEEYSKVLADDLLEILNSEENDCLANKQIGCVLLIIATLLVVIVVFFFLFIFN